VRRLIPVLILLAIAAALFVATAEAPRGVVDWRAVRAVVIESDDWGLCGFVPDADALAELRRDALDAGRFPAVYWASTLEDSASVAGLAAVLARHRGADGLPVLFQPNYIVSWLSYRDPASGGDPWLSGDLPALPPRYHRPGLWDAVAAATAAGIWRPELHGAYHYDPDLRRERVVPGSLAAAAAARGVVVFPGIARAWELAPWRTRAALARELDRSLAVFALLHGRRPASIIAPDYVWDGRCEDLWAERGLSVIQAKREQRRPLARGPALLQRAEKVLARLAARLAHPDRVYLDRNCRLETAQAADPGRVVAACHGEVRRAWARGEPAVIESHRVNYVHTDPAVSGRGRGALDDLLTRLDAEAPLYLCDAELAQLVRSGTSVLVRGGRLVIRNLTHAHRLVPVPGPGGQKRLVPVPPLTTLTTNHQKSNSVHDGI
jgi:hypothetical protein